MSGTSETATDQPPAWAVWVGDSKDNQCVPVLANDKQNAMDKAVYEAEDYDDVYHVDAPFENSEPGVWEFEFRTEHRERIVVEAPNEEYAKETAEAERDYRGEYVQTVHTTSRRLEADDGE